MVREDEVDAAGMNVDGRRAKQPQRHRRAFDVPPGAARRDAEVRELPPRLPVAAPLPQHEIAGVFFRVAVGVHARADLHALGIESCQPAVIGHRRDLEVDGAVAAVRVPVGLERGDHRRHGAQIRLVGRARRLSDGFESQRPRVLAEHRDVLIRVRAQIDAGLLRAGDRAIVHVGVVHDVLDAVAEQMPERAAKNVGADEGAEVADVAAGVDRQAAGVHPHGAVGTRTKVLFASRQRVVQPHGLVACR